MQLHGFSTSSLFWLAVPRTTITVYGEIAKEKPHAAMLGSQKAGDQIISDDLPIVLMNYEID